MMATINDLNQSISDMTDEELIVRLRDMRQSRRTHKTPVRVVKPIKKNINVTADLIKELEEMMKT